MADYNEQEQDVIRRAAFGAIALVSKADPGFFATFKESAAGSKVLATAPDTIKGFFRGGLIAPPKGDATQVEQSVLSELSQAVQLLAKNPADQAAYKNVITTAVQQVAQASKGVVSSEQAIIAKVTQALGVASTQPPVPKPGPPPTPQPPTTPAPPAVPAD
ncbi:hypothetical protein [Luteipulveratus mongoliensis]|uniref:Uncharacterized protein n=1 Tax=Luteipulveratus mongoliensis TaxID=571913 RepID=A0A0K1JGM8_9MICO|nr:hypothetical protein [Luteipulveratus mongoliensis]AKU15877.1 hypothetical protein VV02_08465 [Luteipulveratus mongoliensis]